MTTITTTDLYKCRQCLLKKKWKDMFFIEHSDGLCNKCFKKNNK